MSSFLEFRHLAIALDPKEYQGTLLRHEVPAFRNSDLRYLVFCEGGDSNVIKDPVNGFGRGAVARRWHLAGAGTAEQVMAEVELIASTNVRRGTTCIETRARETTMAQYITRYRNTLEKALLLQDVNEVASLTLDLDVECLARNTCDAYLDRLLQGVTHHNRVALSSSRTDAGIAQLFWLSQFQPPYRHGVYLARHGFHEIDLDRLDELRRRRYPGQIRRARLGQAQDVHERQGALL